MVKGGYANLRQDLRLIADMIPGRIRVLDVGCGDGDLLSFLVRAKKSDGRGIELSQEGVNACVKRGLAVIQGDADTDLIDYPDDAFDYVILSQTIQAMRDPCRVLREMVRIGRYGIVSLPNFGYWRLRWQLLVTGQMPKTSWLDHSWHSTPNIHLCTVKDFIQTCRDNNIKVIRDTAPDASWWRRLFDWSSFRASNFWHSQAIFLLCHQDKLR